MTIRSKRAWILPLLFTIVSIVVIGATLSLRFLDLDTYKGQIIAQVKSALNRDLRYHDAEFSIRFGPSFTFHEVVIKEKDGASDFIRADRLTIRLAIIPLLRKELVLSRMQLERPVLELSRDKNGVFNISDLLTGPSQATVKGVELKKGRIRFTDGMVAEKPLVTELADTDLYLSRLIRGENCDFKLSASLVSGQAKVPLFLAGVARLPGAGQPFERCEIDGRIKTGYLDAGHFWPYYSRFVPFKSLAGFVSLQAHFKGHPNAFKSKGEVKAARLDLDYPQIFHARLTPKAVDGAFELEMTGRDIDMPKISLDVDGLNVRGNCRLSDIHSGDMRITAKATMNRFDLRNFRQYIPYGIIVKDTADFIEQKIMAGYYRLEEGRLDGRVSQILHMERGTNYNILSVRAHVDEGVVNYGSGLPVFSGIKGELLLAGKDFVLKGMSGRFGTSPMTLEGRIADYCLDTPSRYLFTANVQPRQHEAAWLLGPGKWEKVVLSDGAALRLKGEGTSSVYNLSGDCDLKNASYTLPDLMAKPHGRPNTLSFKSTFTKDEFRMNSLTYTLAPLALSASSVNRYKGGVALDLVTNQFSAAEIAPLAPVARKYQPSGRVQAQLHAAGTTMGDAIWTGNVALAGASVKLSDSIKPLTGINGSLRIGADSVDSSQITAHVGSSVISGRGSLTGFKSPTVSLAFTSPSLDPYDIGLLQAKSPLRAEKVQGTLSYNKESDQLQINYLSGALGRSILQMRGTVRELQRAPQIDLSVTSPHLELEDLTAVFGSSSGSKTRFTVKAQVTAAEGRARDIAFQRFKGTVMLEDKILYLQPVEFNVFDGVASGRMRIDLGSAVPHYQVNCTLQKASADRVMRAMGVHKQELTGSMSVQGELSAKGETTAEWRRTALGAVKLKVEHGTLKQFATLSKIFSILNFSQLFKLHLPDMVSGGMPYNKITGDFAIKDGSASTQNLFMDSNAINLSAVGKLDMVKDELDMKIGVQPLQTVDKVVSHIPIVGWILTGKDHSLVTTYFEARGPVADPKVTAVPVKSLAKGVMNIFKRVFELPGRLITDTGEVMIGK